MLSNLPGDVKTVAVMSLHGNCFHRNTGQLKGLWLLHARLLQKEGFHVAVVCTNQISILFLDPNFII